MPRYAMVIEKRRGSNYSAFVPDLPGCIVTGDSVEEVRRLMEAGITFHIEGMRKDGLPVPEPTTVVDYCEVPQNQDDVGSVYRWLRESPLVGAKLDLRRARKTTRKVKL